MARPTRETQVTANEKQKKIRSKSFGSSGQPSTSFVSRFLSRFKTTQSPQTAFLADKYLMTNLTKAFHLHAKRFQPLWAGFCGLKTFSLKNGRWTVQEFSYTQREKSSSALSRTPINNAAIFVTSGPIYVVDLTHEKRPQLIDVLTPGSIEYVTLTFRSCILKNGDEIAQRTSDIIFHETSDKEDQHQQKNASWLLTLESNAHRSELLQFVCNWYTSQHSKQDSIQTPPRQLEVVQLHENELISNDRRTPYLTPIEYNIQKAPSGSLPTFNVRRHSAIPTQSSISVLGLFQNSIDSFDESKNNQQTNNNNDQVNREQDPNFFDSLWDELGKTFSGKEQFL